MQRVVLTGATGFVGQHLLGRLMSSPNLSTLAVVREPLKMQPGSSAAASVTDIGPATDWSSIVSKADVIVHTAARVHIPGYASNAGALADFRRLNVDATVNLARQAAMRGARRFIFISSVKVNGENTLAGRSFSADDMPHPVDAYGLSKLEAEHELKQIAAQSKMDVVIIRPPLIYGPGVKANFLSMMSWVYRGMPLPFGSISNRRSLLAVDNLVDLIVTCIDHAAASNQTLLVSDGEDLSTPELLRRLGAALGRKVHLFSVSKSVLEIGGRLVNRSDMVHRLCESLQIDMQKTARLLGWKPPVSTSEGLKRTADSFLRSRQS